MRACGTLCRLETAAGNPQRADIHCIVGKAGRVFMFFPSRSRNPPPEESFSRDDDNHQNNDMRTTIGPFPVSLPRECASALTFP